MAEEEGIVKADLERIDGIIADYREQKWGLIPLLHEIQKVVGYVPPEVIPRIASGLGLFPSYVQGVISFYMPGNCLSCAGRKNDIETGQARVGA